MNHKLLILLLITFVLVFPYVSALTTIDDVNITTSGNITASWFKGLFNWIVDSNSINYLSFNGSTLILTSNVTQWFYNQTTTANFTNIAYKNNSEIITGNWTFNANINGSGIINFSNLIQASQFLSSVATGTAPFVVKSTTTVTNLGADTVDGLSVGTSGSAIPSLASSNTFSAGTTQTTAGLTVGSGQFTIGAGATGVIGGGVGVADDVAIDFGNADDITMEYLSVEQLFHIYRNSNQLANIELSAATLYLTGNPIRTGGTIRPTVTDGSHDLGSSANPFGIAYVSQISDGTAIAPTQIVSRGTAQTMSGVKTLTTTTPFQFRAAAQNISSPAANVLNIGAGATLNILTPTTNTIFNSTGQTINNNLNILGNLTFLNVPTGSSGTDTDYLCINTTSGRVFRNETGC